MRFDPEDDEEFQDDSFEDWRSDEDFEDPDGENDE